MSAVQALKAARDAGVRIGIYDDALTLERRRRARCRRALPAFASQAGVIELLRTGNYGWSGEEWRALFDERAGITEFDGGLPRQEAECRAFACCVAEWLNRNSMRSPPGRCLGCGGRDHAHDALLPFGTKPTGHTWLHSRCWDAWHASRKVEAAAALSTFGISMRTLP